MRVPQFLQSSAIGPFVGMLPETGATAAAFIRYSRVRRTSPRPESFGKGERDGLIAAETSKTR